MKKSVALIIIVLLFSALLFAESKQFIRIVNSGGVGAIIVSDGGTTFSSTSFSCDTGFSVGWMGDDYSLSLSSIVGSNGLTTALSYSKNLSDSFYFGLDIGAVAFNGSGFSFGALFGTRFQRSNRTMNLALAAEFGYRSYSDYSTFSGILGLVFNESITINDNLALGVGMTLGGIPLVNKFYDKESKTKYSLSAAILSFGLTTSLTYLY